MHQSERHRDCDTQSERQMQCRYKRQSERGGQTERNIKPEAQTKVTENVTSGEIERGNRRRPMLSCQKSSHTSKGINSASINEGLSGNVVFKILAARTVAEELIFISAGSWRE